MQDQLKRRLQAQRAKILELETEVDEARRAIDEIESVDLGCSEYLDRIKALCRGPETEALYEAVAKLLVDDYRVGLQTEAEQCRRQYQEKLVQGNRAQFVLAVLVKQYDALDRGADSALLEI